MQRGDLIGGKFPSALNLLFRLFSCPIIPAERRQGCAKKRDTEKKDRVDQSEEQGSQETHKLLLLWLYPKDSQIIPETAEKISHISPRQRIQKSGEYDAGGYNHQFDNIRLQNHISILLQKMFDLHLVANAMMITATDAIASIAPSNGMGRQPVNQNVATSLQRVSIIEIFLREL